MELTPFSVRVPATSANLGPGFDALGLTLDLHNIVRVEPAAALKVVLVGEGASTLAVGQENLVWRALATGLRSIGQGPPPLCLTCENRIPLARGLGSSSAAIVGGLLAAAQLSGGRLDQDALLALAVEIEGHPDNVTPALLGGIRVCVQGEQGLCQTAVEPARPLQAVVFIPDFQMVTAEARRLLLTTVPLRDAIYNLGRAALLVAALAGGDYTLLAEATRDRLHQTPRSALFPAMPAFFTAALEAGALGAFLSGAGPTLLALVEGEGVSVQRALEETAAREGVAGRSLVVAVGVPGAAVLP